MRITNETPAVSSDTLTAQAPEKARKGVPAEPGLKPNAAAPSANLSAAADKALEQFKLRRQAEQASALQGGAGKTEQTCGCSGTGAARPAETSLPGRKAEHHHGEHQSVMSEEQCKDVTEALCVGGGAVVGCAIGAGGLGSLTAGVAAVPGCAKGAVVGGEVGHLIGKVLRPLSDCDRVDDIKVPHGSGGAGGADAGTTGGASGASAESSIPLDSIMFQNSDGGNQASTIPEGVCEVGEPVILPQVTAGPGDTTVVVNDDGTFGVYDSNGQLIAQGEIEGSNDGTNSGTVDAGHDDVDPEEPIDTDPIDIEDEVGGGDFSGGDGGFAGDGGIGSEGLGDGGDAPVGQSGESGCFVAGTPVLLGDGTFAPIEQVRVNDIVIARNEQSGITTPRRVLRSWSHRNHPTLVLQLTSGAIIETTKEHRFAVPGRGFIAAANLSIGDLVMTHAGQAAEIAALETQEGRFTVYNLTVETDHTYFVGDSRLWVHNDKDEHVSEDDLHDPNPHVKSNNTP
jgi:hypothetical protein